MNYSTAVFIINSDVMAIMGTYDEGHPKTMFKTLDRSIKVGDLVIVPTDTRHKMTCIKVTDVDVNVDLNNPQPIAWVINKVDTDGYKSLLSQEAQAIEIIKAAEFKKARDDMRAAIVANAAELKALPIFVEQK